MELLHPGVYIQEIPSGVRPIEGASTSNAAFIGKAEMGTVGKAQLITSAAEFETRYGGFLSDSYLAHAIFHFFSNGGKKTYVVRVTGSGAAIAAISIKDRKSDPTETLTIKAANEGAWGNKLQVVITDGRSDPDNEFTLRLFRGRSDVTPSLPPLLLETHENLSMNRNADNFVERVVEANSRYVVVKAAEGNQSTAEKGTSRSGTLPVGNGAVQLKLGKQNGGDEGPGSETGGGTSRSGEDASKNPDADKRKFMIELNGDGFREITIPPAANTGDEIADAIKSAVSTLKANDKSKQGAYDDFSCVFKEGRYLLTSGMTGSSSTVVVKDSTSAVELKLGLRNGGSEKAGEGGQEPTRGTSESGEAPSTNPAPDKRIFKIALNRDTVREITIPPTTITGPEIAKEIQKAVRAQRADTVAQKAYDDFTCEFKNGRYLLTSGTTGPLSTVVVDDFDGRLRLPLGSHRFVIFINGDGPHEVELTGSFDDGDAIRKAIQDEVQTIKPKRAVNKAAFESFACAYQNQGGDAANPSLLLTSGKAGLGSSVSVSNATNANVAGLLKLGLTNGGREVNGSAVLRPANSATPGTEYQLGDASANGNVHSVEPGADGDVPVDADHTRGLNALDLIRDVNIVAIPGVGSLDIVAAGANYCGLRGDCFFIGETKHTDVTVEDAQKFMNGLTVKNSYAALYYPWLRMADPTGVSRSPILVPASGIVIWGARTLATRSNPEYRYIPVRRTAIFLEQSIYNGIQYAVFEPNDAGLWSSLRLNIGAFMLLQFRAGAFQGRTPAEAFFVKVDETTTTQQDIDAGVVNIVVGFAPLKPAEFVVLKLTQKAGQPAV
jgi:hypothetical protein